MSAILAWLATPQGAMVVLGILGTAKVVIDGINTIWAKKDAADAANESRFTLLEKTFMLAWHSAESIAELTGQGKLDDYLKTVDKMLTAMGAPSLNDTEKTYAKASAETLSKAAKSPVILNLNDLTPSLPRLPMPLASATLVNPLAPSLPRLPMPLASATLVNPLDKK